MRIIIVKAMNVPKPASTQSATPQKLPARVSSKALLGTQGELLIAHNGREYRLRLTQNGKLILTA
jgi:hemin uptake protein HemP